VFVLSGVTVSMRLVYLCRVVVILTPGKTYLQFEINPNISH
jgi:hypothetical protein